VTRCITPPSAPRISFASPELLFKVLSGKHWELLNAMPGFFFFLVCLYTAMPYNARHAYRC
jgi:hypothetical protein